MSLGRKIVQCQQMIIAVQATGRQLLTVGSGFTITASIQSPTLNDLESLPEGRRGKLAAVLYTAQKLYMGGDPNQLLRGPDQVQVPWTGEWCEVIGFQNFWNLVNQNKYFVSHLTAIQ